jgi:hypothetical protein
VSPVLPAALVHRGRHAAAGVLLDHRLAGPDAARRRALALWEPGARVIALEGGLLVRFARPRTLDTASTPGHLALEEGGQLLAAPLTAAELAAFDPPPGSVIAVRAGLAVALTPGAELDPAAWLGLAPALVEVEPLGEPPPPPAPAPPPAAPDVRRALAVAPATPETTAALAALRAALARPGTSQPASGLAARAGGALGGLGAWLARKVSILAALFARPARLLGRPGALARPARPGPVSRAIQRLWKQLLLVTRLARLAGIRQGAYVGRLLRMFERGDLGEALRHAIPLGGEGGMDERLALGVPGARERLEIVPGALGPSAHLSLGPALYGEMQRLYRRAFEQLEAQGRLDEAAFVLAELLRADEEAVSFLERHDRAQLAAELAEARGLAPGLVVRQWFLAGDLERAVAVARARGAFADAVDRLERTRRLKEAQALAVCWAEDLAEAGDLENAVAVACRVSQGQRLAQRWIELAVAAGGPAGHALLRAWLELDPARFPEVRERVLAACADEGPDGPLRRAAVARGLLGPTSRVPDSPELGGARCALARPVVRGLLRDRALGRAAGGDLERLAALAADGAFDADLPRTRPRPASTTPASLVLDAGDRGTRSARDAAILPSGHILAALGEGGAALLARDGRVLARLDAPAHRLVVSDLGTRALALAPRGEAVRVSRLDLEARTAHPVRDLRIHGFAARYDGATWAIAAERRVLIVDCLRDDLRTLWHVSDLPGVPLALASRAGELSFATVDRDGASEGWTYALPNPTLRRRAPLPPATRAFPCAPVALAGGEWYAAHPAGTEDDNASVLRRAVPDAPGGFALPAGPSAFVQLAGAELLAVALRVEAGIEVDVLEPPGFRLLGKVLLGGAQAARVRLAGRQVTVADDRGRVVGLDLAEGRVSHDVRV